MKSTKTDSNPVTLAALKQPNALISISRSSFSAHAIKREAHVACTMGIESSIGHVAFSATEAGYRISQLNRWRKEFRSPNRGEAAKFLSRLESTLALINLNAIEDRRVLVGGYTPGEGIRYSESSRLIVSLDDPIYSSKYRTMHRFTKLLEGELASSKELVVAKMKSSFTPYIWMAHAIMAVRDADKSFFENYVHVSDDWLALVVERSFISKPIENYMISRIR
ncbi:hypothetical protein H3V53_29020 [Paraburkholderia bengalensis]|uniref:Uncharacterized protein n=1 Tax=Paraburkholderia bengalensis TaxID=2747562 RepID=A0ABU8IZL9_9BURK